MNDHHHLRKPDDNAKRLGSVGWAPMDADASAIAVSEMTGVPVAELCSYVLVAVRHSGQGHTPIILPSNPDLRTVVATLEHAASCVRASYP